MLITGGQTIEVFRQSTVRDRYGDVERTSVGTIDHVVFQWASAASVGLRFHPSDAFRETSDLSAVMFIPKSSPLKIEPRDRVKMGDNYFQVVGDRAWDENHPATGYDYGYYMIQVEMTS